MCMRDQELRLQGGCEIPLPDELVPAAGFGDVL